MMNLTSLIRAYTRCPAEPLNILTVPTHERTEVSLAQTGHNFWAVRKFPQTKDWNTKYAEVPENYHLLGPEGEPYRQIPPDVHIDLVLSQNKFGQYQILAPIAHALHVPLICYEHTLPQPGWLRSYIDVCKQMRGHINVFISEYSLGEWGWKGEKSAKIIHHGIDADLFSCYNSGRQKHLLSVVNDWVNRRIPCGYDFWERATKGLPVKVVGDTPGLSKPAAGVEELAQHYREAQIFVNTSQVSPIPTALLEAMACGCCVVSAATCMIPEVITHGVNGFLANTESELRALCVQLLDQPELCKKVGERARETILEKFTVQSFVDNWNRVFYEAAQIVPFKKGEYFV